MKSLFPNDYIINYHSYLILLIILAIVQQSSSAAAIPSRNLISLYNSNDKVTVLTSQNFSSTVYHSNTSWLIEFYSSWCGHCISYANIYREIGIDTWGWKAIVRIGAINCYPVENSVLCKEHDVGGYPALRLIPAGAVFGSTSKVINLPADDAKDVERELIKELDGLHKKNKLWPYFTPVNRVTFEDLYARISSTVKLLLVIVENRKDFTGRQLMLDFSNYHKQLAIFRTTTDGRLWRKFHINLTDVPALFVILRNRTAERIQTKQNISENVGNRNLLNHAIRSYIQMTKRIENFDNRDLEEIILSKNVLKNAEIQQKLIQNKNETDEVVDRNTVHRKVSMIDLELALSYMLRQEIPQMKEINGESYVALVDWLTVLTKYFPGSKPVLAYLKELLSKVNQQAKSLTGDQFREMTDINTSNAYLPDNHDQYQSCSGSAPQYRGYPCALWLLFHTLTVAQVQTESKQINIIEIPLAIKNYIKHFFSCRLCSNNFMKETNNINELDLDNKYEAMIYLWKVHNHVNKRLHGETTEDPKHPKVQFPSQYSCRTCRTINNTKTENEFDVTNTITFLLKYYSKQNIERPIRLNEEGDKTSKTEYNKIGLVQLFTSIIQRFQLYIFIGFIILIILFRRRYCKATRERYISKNRSN